MSGSRIFRGYRALGLCSSNVPLAVRPNSISGGYSIYVAIGKCFQTFNFDGLTLANISDSLPQDISCIVANPHFIICSAGDKIYLFAKGKFAVSEISNNSIALKLLLELGSSDLLVSLDAANYVKIWDLQTRDMVFQLHFALGEFAVSAILSPKELGSKLLLGSEQGGLCLYNTKTNKLLHSFDPFPAAITVLANIPDEHLPHSCKGLVAIGLRNGSIVIFNIIYGKIVKTYQHEEDAIATIAFRTDVANTLMLIAGNAVGQLTVWDLSTDRMLCQRDNAHMEALVGLFCIPCAPYVITNAGDNAVKVWAFDASNHDIPPLLLHHRLGYWRPPRFVGFWSDNANILISAGGDSTVRSFHTQNEKLHRCWGRAYQPGFTRNKMNRKKKLSDQRNEIWSEQDCVLPPVMELCGHATRAGVWDTVAACHEHTRGVTTWNYNLGKRGQYYLDPKVFALDARRHKRTVATCLYVTFNCWFVVVGYSTGHVMVFNIQSGLERGQLGDKCHNNSVVGVAVNNTNRICITCGDQRVIFWNFVNRKVISELSLAETVVCRCWLPECDILAVGTSTGSVQVIDCVNQCIMRHFQAHSSPPTVLTLSPGGKWLLSTSSDCCVKTWDIIDAKLIDAFRVERAIVSMALSPAHDFLATVHEQQLGVYLWSNRSLYVPLTLSPLDPTQEAALLALPESRIMQMEVDNLLDESGMDLDASVNPEVGTPGPEQLGEGALTISTVPNAYFTMLMDLDLIMERNKPRDALTKPQEVPFFLSTIMDTDRKQVEVNSSTVPERELAPLGEEMAKLSKSRKRKKNKSTLLLESSTSLTSLLFGASGNANVRDLAKCCFEHLKTLTPSQVDYQITALCPDFMDLNLAPAIRFLEIVHFHVKQKLDFDLASLYLATFVKRHSELLQTHADLLRQTREIVDDICEVQATTRRIIDRVLKAAQYCHSDALSL